MSISRYLCAEMLSKQNVEKKKVCLKYKYYYFLFMCLCVEADAQESTKNLQSEYDRNDDMFLYLIFFFSPEHIFFTFAIYILKKCVLFILLWIVYSFQKVIHMNSSTVLTLDCRWRCCFVVFVSKTFVKWVIYMILYTSKWIWGDFSSIYYSQIVFEQKISLFVFLNALWYLLCNAIVMQQNEDVFGC